MLSWVGWEEPPGKLNKSTDTQGLLSTAVGLQTSYTWESPGTLKKSTDAWFPLPVSLVELVWTIAWASEFFEVLQVIIMCSQG